MSDPDASPVEMPRFPFPRRPAPELDEPLLDALLSGRPLPLHAPEQAHTVAGMLASMADPAGPGALAGEAAARSAFARAASPAGIQPAGIRKADGRARRRSPRLRPASLPARIAAALIVASAGLGGAAVAAYAQVLPGPVQELAHRVIGAPAPAHAASTGHPASPAPPQPAATGLCEAYQRARVHGSPAVLAVLSGKLARAAGGAGKIGGYCAAAERPGAAPGSGGVYSRGMTTSPGSPAKAHPQPTPHPRPTPHPTPSHPL